MSWTPPHPVSGGQPAPGPFVGQPYAVPLAPPPPPVRPRRTRTGLIVLLVALPLALIVAVSAALISTVTKDKPLSDAQGRVTLTVPGTWSNDTTDDAGQRVEHGKYEEDNYTVPDLEAGGLTGSVLVFIDDRAATPAAEVHKATLSEECELAGCNSRGQPARVEVHGRRGTEQILGHPDNESTVVLTLESDAFVVTLIGSSLEEDQAVV